MEEVPCACGCGQLLIPFDNRNRPRQYIRNHQTKSLVWSRSRPYTIAPTKGKKASEETRHKLSESHKGQTAWNKGTHGLMPPVWNKGMKGAVTHTIETRKKVSVALSGPKSYLWKGGVSRYPRPQSMDWNITRKEIYQRDNWKCQICKKAAGNKLQCHHVIPRRYGGSDLPINLASVCVSCHKKQEPRYGHSDYFWGLFIIAQ